MKNIMKEEITDMNDERVIRTEQGLCPRCCNNNISNEMIFDSRSTLILIGHTCNSCMQEWLDMGFVENISHNGRINYKNACTLGFEGRGNVSMESMLEFANSVKDELLGGDNNERNSDE